MSVIDDVADHISKGRKMPGPDWKSLSEIVKQASDSNHLSKLQRVASEQLAALVLADFTTDKVVSPVEASDLRLDENGDFTIGENGNVVWLGTIERRAAAVGKRYSVINTPHKRMAREAVRYAKALLEITE